MKLRSGYSKLKDGMKSSGTERQYLTNASTSVEKVAYEFCSDKVLGTEREQTFKTWHRSLNNAQFCSGARAMCTKCERCLIISKSIKINPRFSHEITAAVGNNLLERVQFAGISI